MAVLSSKASFAVIAGVLALSLWASGSPAMVYPVYVEHWGATPLQTTALFSTYPVALVVALTLAGSLSDLYGRRPVLLTGLGIVAAGTLVFVSADGLGWLYPARALQGIGVGTTLSAAAAALTEFDTSGRPARVSAANTAATSVGAAVAIALGGALVQFSDAPARAPFVALLTAIGILFLLLVFLPAGSRAPGRWRPTRPRVPTVHRGQFLLGTATVASAFVMGGVILALGAQIARELVGSHSTVFTGLALASWPLVGIPASLIAHRVGRRSLSVWGGVAAAAGSLLLLPAASAQSLVLFVGSSVLSGFGYGLLFSAGFSLVTAAAPPNTRAGTFSTMYLTVYLAQAVGAVAVGALATSVGLSAALVISMPIIALLCAGAGVAGLWDPPDRQVAG